MRNQHDILIPFPAQAHIIPFMELSHCLVKHGFKITFVNTEFNHERILTALQQDNKKGQINLISIQDGLAEEERHNIGKLFESMKSILPVKVEEIISQINNSDDEDDITCIISDIAWALEVGEKMGIHMVSFWTASAGMSALICNIPKLTKEGIIHPDGALIKNQQIQLSPDMPTIDAAKMVWLNIGDLETQKICFQSMIRGNQAAKTVNLHICNSTDELKSAAFVLTPQLLSIGPLHTSRHIGQSMGNFWPEDSLPALARPVGCKISNLCCLWQLNNL